MNVNKYGEPITRPNMPVMPCRGCGVDLQYGNCVCREVIGTYDGNVIEASPDEVDKASDWEFSTTPIDEFDF